ncbi:MAG: acetolactate synthase small subunit [Cyclobacteriaceae bacterium]|nr:acetolactate synthase small subunit [Cyclobacteriaceae bacterium]
MGEIKTYTISIFTENHVGLLNRITIIFTKRRLNIESLNTSESEIKGIHRFTIVVNVSEETVIKLVKQIEKQIEVVRAFYHIDEETVFQEIALYKVHTNTIVNGIKVESLIRDNHARILAIENDFIIIEKTGRKEETNDLLKKLEPYGIMEFVRSGRVSVTKPLEHMGSLLKIK